MPLFLRQTAGRASAHGHPALADLLNVRPLPELACLHMLSSLAAHVRLGLLGSQLMPIFLRQTAERLSTRPPCAGRPAQCQTLLGTLRACASRMHVCIPAVDPG